MTNRGVWTPLVIASVWLAVGLAHAQTPPESGPASTALPAAPAEAPEAREAFVRGTGLAREGSWTEALAAFEESDRKKPHPITAYNIGYVERALGHYTRARSALTRALAPGGVETLPEELAAEAREYLSEAEQKIAHVRVIVQGDKIAVSVDGRPLERESKPTDQRRLLIAGTRPPGPPEALPFPVFDLLVDPGQHVISAKGPDGRTEAIQREAAVGVANQWTIRMQERVEAAKAEPPKAAAAPPVASEAPQPAVDKRTWAFVAYGAGAAGLVVGTTFGLIAMSNRSRLEDECRAGGACPPSLQDEIDAYDLHTTLSTVGFAVAIAGGAVGTYLLLTDSSGDRTGRARMTLRARIGPSGAALVGRF